MTSLDQRRESMEAKYARNEEIRFRLDARRNKLLGHWAADQFGLIGPDREAYVLSVIRADLQEPGEEDVFVKLASDFASRGIERTDKDIRAAMAEMRSTAIKQMETENS